MTDTATRHESASIDDLLTLVSRVVDQARPGEELEVYASRGVETDVRAYDGEIEQLSSAASAGVGIRVVAAQRQGFAYAGTLCPSLPQVPGEVAKSLATASIRRSTSGPFPMRLASRRGSVRRPFSIR